MKKYFAMMVAVLFVFGIFGMSFAQSKGPEVPKAADPTPSPAKKGQQMTPEKEKAYGTPGVAKGSAEPPKDKGKQTAKQKKRQAETPEKKKMKEADAKKAAGGSGLGN
jgi:hypothetical protein